MNELSETDKAYIAGLVDGEGCFYIGRRTDKTGTVVFNLVVMVSQCDQEYLQYWCEKVGIGGVYMVERSKKHNHHNSYQWRIGGNKAIRKFISTIFPYLVLKKEQAKTALDFMEFQGFSGRALGRKSSVSVSVSDNYRAALTGMKIKARQENSIPERARTKINHPRLF